MGGAIAVAVVLIGVALFLLNSSSGGGSGDSSSGGGGAVPAPGGTALPSAKLQQLAAAIAQAEGFGIEGAIPTLANNPGDLVRGDQGHGTIGSGITVYGSVEEGWNALYHELGLIFSGTSKVYNTAMSFAEMAAHWTLTETGAWANNVASYVGASVNDSLASWFKGL